MEKRPTKKPQKLSEAFKKQNLFILALLLIIFIITLLLFTFFPLPEMQTSDYDNVNIVFKSGKTTLQEKFDSGKTILQAEIADNYEKRIVGLMDKEHLDENKGMLFIFKEDKEISFWMKNMNFPIDIIFVNSNNEITKIIENAPLCNKKDCKNYYSEQKVKYVIEVNAGYTDKNNIKTGQIVSFDI